MKISKPYLFLTALTCFFCWYFVGRHGMFASGVDWICQHSVFPDYFRRQFYETGQLFFEFTPNLGGGQNSYNFSYYSMYSPVVLFSYLLPFIKMSDYLIAASICCLLASVLLFYRWLLEHGFATEICLFAAVLFLLASPMIYQSYRQVMFVNYMPFLCMAFLGVDQYWKSGRRGLLTAGVFFMIMTSFYFSIAGMFALLLYGVGRCKKTTWKRAWFWFLLPFAAAVLASGILLVPTAHALLSRGQSARQYSLLSLLIPDFSLSRFAYHGYGVGLTAEILVVLFLGFTYKDRGEKFLSVCCFLVLTIPVFPWLLNGGLYLRDKALIPFLPLLCYLVAVCLEKLKQREISFLTGLMACLLAGMWCVFFVLIHGGNTAVFVYALFEAALLAVFLLLYRKRRSLVLLIAPSVLCLFAYGLHVNRDEGAIITRDTYEKVTDLSFETAISDVLDGENGLYRLEQGGTWEEKKANINRIWDTRQWVSSVYSSVSQSDYQTFCRESFQTEQPFRNGMMQSASQNPLFQKLMGIKYIAERKGRGGEVVVSANEQAAPVIYATDRVISQAQYQDLPFPQNQTSLMQNAVVETGDVKWRELETAARQTDFILLESKKIIKDGDGYLVQTEQDLETSIFVNREDNIEREELFYLQFDVENNKNHRDVTIDLAGMRNKLSANHHIYYNRNTTFTYVVKLAAYQAAVPVSFKQGSYRISNIKSFLGDDSILADDSLYQSEFEPDWERTRGNQISGEIRVKNAGYLITSIPYDEGFEIYVDGKQVEGQKVNTAFLGASIEKGLHQITIRYHAPGFSAGGILSCVGAALWVFTAKSGRRRRDEDAQRRLFWSCEVLFKSDAPGGSPSIR